MIVLSTFSDLKSARELGKEMVQARLCACVNIVKVQSIYSWKGKVEDHEEFLVLFKATDATSPKLRSALADLHPYDVPEIVELKMSAVAVPYLSWLAAETSPDGISKNRNYPTK